MSKRSWEETSLHSAHVRRLMPGEVFCDVFAWISRDDLDSVQLTCMNLRDYVNAKDNVLPLRLVEHVEVGLRREFVLRRPSPLAN